MKYSLFILFFISALLIKAQGEFEEEQLNRMLQTTVNQFRKENDLPSFEVQERLNAAAFDQAAFLITQSRLVHTQENKKKENLKDRLFYYNALYAEAGENLAEVEVGTKVTIDQSGKKVIIETEEQAIQAALQFWKQGGDSELNIKDPLFRHFGSAVIKEENRLIMVVVMAGLPYTFPKGETLNKIKTKLEPYDRSACNELQENHGTIPQLFSDAFHLEGKEIYFQFHSLSTVDAILSDAADGIAVEIVGDYQFSCGEPNRIFPAESQMGYLLTVAKKGKFSLLNEAEEKGAVRLKLADLPAAFEGASIELNGFVLKGNHRCFSIPYNHVKVENLRDWGIDFQYSGELLAKNFSWQDTLVKTYKLNNAVENNPASIVKELSEYIHAFKFQPHAIKLNWALSPTLNKSKWKTISHQLMSELSGLIDTSIVEQNDEVNHQALNEFLSNSVYAIDANKLEGEELNTYLHEASMEDSSLAHFLKNLSQLSIELIGVGHIEENQASDTKLEMFNRLVENQKIDQALLLQLDLIQHHPELHGQLISQIYDQEAEYIQLINNQIVLTAQKGMNVFQGNPLHLAFLEIYLVSSLPIVSFNKLLAELKYWAKNPKQIKGVDSWESSYAKLRNSSLISNELYAQTAINFYLIAADYYYEEADYTSRRKAFDQLMKYTQSANLSADEKIKLAQVLCYQDQFDRAIRLLHAEVIKENVSAELLSYFLQIAIYELEEVGMDNYLSLMKKLKEIDLDVFCHFFSKEKRGIQALSEYTIKEMYCENCQTQ